MALIDLHQSAGVSYSKLQANILINSYENQYPVVLFDKKRISLLFRNDYQLQVEKINYATEKNILFTAHSMPACWGYWSR
jgi:hypothetical protein